MEPSYRRWLGKACVIDVQRIRSATHAGKERDRQQPARNRPSLSHTFIKISSADDDMRYSIDFSIFDSPTSAYGNVTGEVEFKDVPRTGERINVLDDLVLKIATLSPVLRLDGHLVVGLEDIVLPSKIAARNLATRLEAEAGLFCIAYNDH
jgi:hypothetical protein